MSMDKSNFKSIDYLFLINQLFGHTHTYVYEEFGEQVCGKFVKLTSLIILSDNFLQL